MDRGVKEKFASYPEDIAILLFNIRKLIYSVAEQDNIFELSETLKWGEPSYISKIGSAIRFDWKPKDADQYGIYFNCKTSLVDTFK